MQPGLVLPALINLLPAIYAWRRNYLVIESFANVPAYRPVAREILRAALKDSDEDVRKGAAGQMRKTFPDEANELLPEAA
jgi:hypothetical protein